MRQQIRGIRTRAVWCVCAVFYAAIAQAQTTALFVDSQPGDSVGGGEQRLFTTADLGFTSNVGSGNSTVSIAARTEQSFSSSEYWDLTFQSGGGLVAGVYENAGRASFLPSVSPGLSIIHSGRGCSRVVGRFVVYEVAISTSGTVTRFAADFEQHCEGATAALFGAIRFNAARSSLEPFDGNYPVYALRVDAAPHGLVTGPGIDCGAGQTDCEETFDVNELVILEALASPGYVFLGWAGLDCVGGPLVAVTMTRRKFCTPVFNAAPGNSAVESPDYSQGAFFLDGPMGNGELATIPLVNRQVYVTPSGPSVTASALSVQPFATTSRVLLRVMGPRNVVWDVWFGAPAGQLLAPGTYEYTSPDPYSQNAGPTFGLTHEQGSSCFAGGRFQIHEIAFTGNVLTNFAADFEAPCGLGLTAGSIRYHSSRASLLPFDGAYPLHALRIASTLGGYVAATGISCGDGGRSDCQETFAVPTNVSLRAFASPGYQFVGWDGSCTDASPVAIAAVNGAIRCIAVFTPSPASTAPADSVLGVATLLLDSPGSDDFFGPALGLWLAGNSNVDVAATASGAEVTFTFASPNSPAATVRFGAANGRLVAGDYEDARGFSLLRGTLLEISHCSVIEGRFRVYEANFDGGGNVLSFAADFEAICTNASRSYVVGAVRFRSTRGRLLPFDGAYPVYKLTIEPAVNGFVTAPGVDCGPGRADCTEQYSSLRTVSLQAMPSPGFRFIGWTGACFGGSTTTLAVNWLRRCSAVFNAVQPGSSAEDPRTRESALYIDSKPGDPAGNGRRHVWLDAALDSGYTDRSSLRLTLRTREGYWSINLAAPGSQELRPGVYENATYPYSSSRTGPGLLIATPWGYCPYSVVGRFTIYQLGISNGIIQSIAADFEQRCTPAAPALVGAVRFNSTRSELRPFPTSGPTALPADFNGDGRVDLLWQNRADGRLAAWFMNGTLAADNSALTPDRITDPAWHIVGTADANRDGLPDLYWHHQTTGALSIWYMADTARSNAVEIWPNAVPDLQWKVRTVVDMDGDRNPDLIWQHTGNGQIAVWFMNGTTIRSGEPLGAGQVADLNWKIVGAGDVNRDGNADLFWHHAVTGQLAVWFMRGRVALSGQALAPDRVADTAWQVRGVGDLDGNGYPDLIWQNTSTFQASAWLLNGLRLVDGRPIVGPIPASADWHIVSPK